MNSGAALILYLMACCAMESEAAKAELPPCCRNSIGTVACRYLQANNPASFANRCNTQADFRLIQCCQLCEADGNVMPKYDQAARNLTQAACFDAMPPVFCAKFVNGQDVWKTGTWNCFGTKSALAFRICRLSCGYCSVSSSTPATLTAANFVYDKAMTQCTGLGNNNDDPDVALLLTGLS